MTKNQTHRLLRLYKKACEIDPAVRIFDGASISVSGLPNTIECSPGSVNANPDFLAEHSDATIVFFWRHEAQHILLKHHERQTALFETLWESTTFSTQARKRFNAKTGPNWRLLRLFWNVATDLEVACHMGECPELHETGGCCPGYREYEHLPRLVAATAESFFMTLVNQARWRNITIEQLKKRGYVLS